MKKRIISVILALAFLFVCACGGSGKNKDSGNSDTSTDSDISDDADKGGGNGLQRQPPEAGDQREARQGPCRRSGERPAKRLIPKSERTRLSLPQLFLAPLAHGTAERALEENAEEGAVVVAAARWNFLNGNVVAL